MTTCEIKRAINDVGNRFKATEEKISELEATVTETTWNETVIFFIKEMDKGSF